MKKFNWEEFKYKNNKIAVHCKTEEEAKDFCNQMHEHGMKWGDGDSYLENINYNKYLGKTCYSNSCLYGGYDFYEQIGYRILEWSDYMGVGNKEFTKADLKDGMVVEYKNGKRRLVIANMLIGEDGFLTLDSFRENLENIKFMDHTIVKIFKIKEAMTFNYILDDDNLKLIWERIEVKHMTVDEMQKKLEELTGERVEFEPSVEEMIGVICKYCRKAKCNTCVIPSGMSCNFANYSKDEVKKAYEKVMEDGRKES
ncbi:hypothetical protein [Blautia hansenii]|uniref:Uncharacterized protein n=1 Tax=Blautia hansenii DSM 20583 TaxID=537007 RepID=C9L7T9_BLAHA|nr:hypothetical protein [Blautia hansenii]ASM69755.1 hypothetical protein CGC63_09420 [Blautia hansenii DSM 20583]EEX21834.1 hypothetical protein BLAHAN_05459 [Blautia hansenii DSM 20583]UWO09507.1 hypothetical protein NQ538_09460 [Blautia hansenii DSM 20583]